MFFDGSRYQRVLDATFTDGTGATVTTHILERVA